MTSTITKPFYLLQTTSEKKELKGQLEDAEKRGSSLAVEVGRWLVLIGLGQITKFCMSGGNVCSIILPDKLNTKLDTNQNLFIMMRNHIGETVLTH